MIEPPLYFPEWFGLDQQYGFIFAHNLFTVQFMWDRLPLYIVAFYPVISQLAYELVRSLGIFRRRGALAGSVAVAFACQVFYEVFDHIGPQLKWWAWNHGQPHRQPSRDGVGADEQHAAVRLGLDGRHDLPGRAAGRRRPRTAARAAAGRSPGASWWPAC